jgi:hypothetical protein
LQQVVGRHVAPLWHVMLIPSHPVFVLTPGFLVEKQQISLWKLLCWLELSANPSSVCTWSKYCKLKTITPPMWSKCVRYQSNKSTIYCKHIDLCLSESVIYIMAAGAWNILISTGTSKWRFSLISLELQLKLINMSAVYKYQSLYPHIRISLHSSH